MENKRLYKSDVNCMICGVCGGIAEYFNIDPTLIRIICGALEFLHTSSVPLLCQNHMYKS